MKNWIVGKIMIVIIFIGGFASGFLCYKPIIRWYCDYKQNKTVATYIIVHGAHDGGWAWRGVERELQAAGHEVFTPTLTGSGERVHLASSEIGLDTHIQDIVNVLRYEDLHDVILVGHSYGGMVITGVAELSPDRINQLIYLDAIVPKDGQSVADIIGPEAMVGVEQVAQAYGDGWRIPHSPPDADRRTDFLLKAAKQPLTVSNSDAACLKHTYVLFTGKSSDDPLRSIFEDIAARVQQEGWNYREIPLEHFPVLNRPHEVASLLLELR